MVKKTNDSNKFTYNDGVIIIKTAPKKFHPGKPGVICGIDRIPTETEAQKVVSEAGDWIYTVEFSDGSSLEISENYLETDPNCLKYCLSEKVIIKRDFADKESSEVVSIIDYHKISGKSLAEKFNLKIGCFIYVIENQSGQISLIPEYLIEKKY